MEKYWNLDKHLIWMKNKHVYFAKLYLSQFFKGGKLNLKFTLEIFTDIEYGRKYKNNETVMKPI